MLNPIAALWRCLLLLVGLFALACAPASAETSVDLELVLAVDASGSVDDGEFALQMGGIAAAFRDPEIIEAITGGPLGRIAVAVVIWSDAQRPKDVLAWRLIRDRATAEAFAARVLRHPRKIPAGGTGIGAAVMFAVKQIESNDITGTRRVVDVSGDGRETTFREWMVPPTRARAHAIRRRVTVNGLAILTDEPQLDDYYRDEVVGGPGSFVQVAQSYDDFAVAIRRKLLREIRYGPPVAWRQGE
ncbi:MAG: DUF1194 domain-containing protein [Alphaproteobacteria bacterium]